MPTARITSRIASLGIVPVPQDAIVRGDQQSQSIAAAAIIAKVERDHMMSELARQYPGYGFEAHRGYHTPEHLRALQSLGPCPAHRRFFSPVSQMLGLAPRDPIPRSPSRLEPASKIANDAQDSLHGGADAHGHSEDEQIRFRF